MKSLSRVGGRTLGRALRSPLHTRITSNCTIARASAAPAVLRRHSATDGHARLFHSYPALQGIMPDAEHPAPRKSEAADVPTVPTDIPTTEFHELADAYLEELLSRLEDAQDATPDLEVEYSVRPTPSYSAIPPLSLTAWTGRRARSQNPVQRPHLCAEQAAEQQADLAKLPHIRAETLRLGGVGRVNASERGGRLGRLGIPTRWLLADRAGPQGAGCRAW